MNRTWMVRFHAAQLVGCRSFAGTLGYLNVPLVRTYLGGTCNPNYIGSKKPISSPLIFLKLGSLNSVDRVSREKK